MVIFTLIHEAVRYRNIQGVGKPRPYGVDHVKIVLQAYIFQSICLILQ